MDLGIEGRSAIVCAGSKGIGRAAARRLSLEGVHVVIVARSAVSLVATAEEIAEESGYAVRHFVADLTCSAGRDALLQAHPEPDILVASPGVPQRLVSYADITREDWSWWFDAHFHAALDLIHGYVPGMSARGFGRVVNVSANFIKFPQAGVPSHAARLALAGAIASLVRQVASCNVTINSVLPGLVNTEALRTALSQRAGARGVPYEMVDAEVRKRSAADRLADPQEVGDLIAMLCAAQLGYVTGQNIVIDGGAYEGLF